MKRLLVLAGIVAGIVAPYLPAYADPHDHPCVGPVDTNCVRTSDGRNCDVYEEDPAGSTCVHEPSGPGYIGGCSFATNDDPTGQIANPGTQTGQISGTVLGFDVGGTNPANTTFHCTVRVNGADVCVIVASGQPIAADAAVCVYTTAAGDVVELCQTITVNGTTLDDTCYPATSVEVPPQEVQDLIDGIVCPLLITLAPVWNPILPDEILFTDQESGDTYALGVKVYDC